MLKNVFQNGILSVFYSLGSDPLQLWGSNPGPTGKIELVKDPVLQSQILSISSDNISQTYITCPADPSRTLGIKLPSFCIQFKTTSNFFSFEIHVMDDKKQRRRFRVNNFQEVARAKPYICTLPLDVTPNEWSSVSLDFGDLTRRVYGTGFQEVLKVIVHANCELRRIYFSEKAFASDEDVPPELKLYAPAT
eukprot:TRINITY_DN9035_c0_g1_i1.p1 TRINITY_DN9035_c0_g1~~TRINITY_DN9035_c0_g1_i1.p1  ORF type:complete len:192 (+),score=26.53 TRINITY_DN9035_c0_g1_i1:8-583(+)